MIDAIPNSPLPTSTLNPGNTVDYASELLKLQATYDEFITSSQQIEEELEKELERTDNELNKVKYENQNFSDQLQEKTQQIVKLEKDLASTQTKLQQQSKLRLDAELAQDSAEDRARQMEASHFQLKKELEYVHEKLAFTESELEESLMDRDLEREESLNQMEELKLALEAALLRAETAESKVRELTSSLTDKREQPPNEARESMDTDIRFEYENVEFLISPRKGRKNVVQFKDPKPNIIEDEKIDIAVDSSPIKQQKRKRDQPKKGKKGKKWFIFRKKSSKQIKNEEEM